MYDQNRGRGDHLLTEALAFEVIDSRVPGADSDAQEAPLPLRINAGGSDVRDGNGNLWVSDAPYAQNGRVFTARAPDAQMLDNIYLSERYASILRYDIETGNGVFDVTLKFAEIYFKMEDLRVFDGTIEGQTMFENLDLFDAAGGQYQTFDLTNTDVTITDGVLDLDFFASKNNAKLSGIEVKVAQDGDTDPTYEPTEAALVAFDDLPFGAFGTEGTDPDDTLLPVLDTAPEAPSDLDAGLPQNPADPFGADGGSDPWVTPRSPWASKGTKPTPFCSG